MTGQPAQPEIAPELVVAEDAPERPSIDTLDLQFPNPDAWTLGDAELIEEHCGRRFSDLVAEGSPPPGVLETRVMLWVENRKRFPDYSLDDYRGLSLSRVNEVAAHIIAGRQADDALAVQAEDDAGPLGTEG